VLLLVLLDTLSEQCLAKEKASNDIG
jgi:hypothetical protein